MNQYWSWILGIIGLLGFYLAGRKVWWCWYVNIFNQVLWFVYSVVTEQYGFLVATFGYLFVFVKNAIAWTKEHYSENEGWDFNEYKYLQDELRDKSSRLDSFPISPPPISKSSMPAKHTFYVDLLDVYDSDKFEQIVLIEKGVWYSSLSPEQRGRGLISYVEDDFQNPNRKKITFEVQR